LQHISRVRRSSSLLIRSLARADPPHVQHLAWRRRAVDHGSTRMIREDAPFVPVLTPREAGLDRVLQVRMLERDLQLSEVLPVETGSQVAGAQASANPMETTTSTLRHMAQRRGRGVVRPGQSQRQALLLPGNEDRGTMAKHSMRQAPSLRDLRSARCAERRTPGAGGDPEKRAGREASTALRVDLTADRAEVGDLRHRAVAAAW
jgi:hypothetical protein